MTLAGLYKPSRYGSFARWATMMDDHRVTVDGVVHSSLCRVERIICKDGDGCNIATVLLAASPFVAGVAISLRVPTIRLPTAPA
ncbi:MAG: hypothetical protein GEU28_11620 [Dehalococcoidia bacterium]|nr:hypothetical protein [Dehalococcoidia bacterium]